MRRSLLSAGVAIVAMQLLAACADTEEQDLCAQYADAASAVDELQQLDPLTARAEDLRAATEDLQAEVDQLLAVSEGRLDTAISALRANIDALRQAALEDAGADALETARPQLEEAAEDLAEAWAVLQQRMEAQCDLT
jgi:hypothetical protein